MTDNEETTPEGEEAEVEEKPKKKGLLMVSGLIAVLGLAFLASTMAIPGKVAKRRLLGPLTGPLTEDKINVNLRDNQSKRYLQFKLHCEYYAYEDDYYTSRLTDPIYMPRLLDALQRITASLTVEEVTGKVNQPLVVQEMVKGINPVIFPIHIGKTAMPSAKEEESGLRPGYSSTLATFHGYIDEHTLHVDGPAKTLQIDDGEVFTFEGTETDFELTTNNGANVFIDITGLNEEFQGELPIGTHGHLQNLLIEHWILQ